MATLHQRLTESINTALDKAKPTAPDYIKGEREIAAYPGVRTDELRSIQQWMRMFSKGKDAVQWLEQAASTLESSASHYPLNSSFHHVCRLQATALTAMAAELKRCK